MQQVSSKLSENSEKYQVNQTKRFSHLKDYYFVDRNGNVYSNRSGEMKKLNQHKDRGGYRNVCLMSKTNKCIMQDKIPSKCKLKFQHPSVI